MLLYSVFIHAIPRRNWRTTGCVGRISAVRCHKCRAWPNGRCLVPWSYLAGHVERQFDVDGCDANGRASRRMPYISHCYTSADTWIIKDSFRAHFYASSPTVWRLDDDHEPD